jgi:NADH-quinone oxidoreductase subunit I
LEIIYTQLRKKKNIYRLMKGLFKGLAITLKHFLKPKNRVDKGIQSEDYFSQRTGSSTLRYPADQIPVPEVGRYQLDIAMDDCIVCDLCAKICPVDCIDIEAIKATEDIGKTSDGTTKRLHAAKFSIDMGKCMFCGLCTVVCPTECLVMTNEYDRSFTDPQELNYVFAEMSEAEAAQKRELAAAAEQAKRDAKAAALAQSGMNKEGQI